MKLHLRQLVAVAALSGASLAQAATDRTPAIDGVVAADTPIEFIKDGFEGTEGPIALSDGSLLFTETRANRITKIAVDGTTSTFLDNTNGSNALAFNGERELISVQTVKPQVGVIWPADRVRVLAADFEGAPLLRPNDLVVDKTGGVYFSDPGVAPKPGEPQPVKSLYYVSAAGKLTRLATDIDRPNGVQLSPDEKTLYVANTSGEFLLAYDIVKPGQLGQRRDFAKLAGYRQTDNGWASGADGLAVDAKGRVYVATNVGIEVFSAKGQALGIVELPKQPQNIAFAGPGKHTLYAVGRGAAYRIKTLTAGYAGRAK
ncbi:MAG: SMP-30/gluconolactonase/LRE family protein [Solimonas sp.]